MKKSHLILGCILFLVVTNVFGDTDKITTGWVEKVMFPVEQLSMDAKIDTGADVSSINAENIKIIQKYNKQWVEFDIENSQHVLKHVTYPLLSFVSIKARDDEKGINRNSLRPLIIMKICLGNQIRNIQIDLIRRERFAYSVLLGREAINQFNILIDPSKKYLLPLKC
jgi:hypothetical protein